MIKSYNQLILEMKQRHNDATHFNPIKFKLDEEIPQEINHEIFQSRYLTQEKKNVQNSIQSLSDKEFKQNLLSNVIEHQMEVMEKELVPDPNMSDINLENSENLDKRNDNLIRLKSLHEGKFKRKKYKAILSKQQKKILLDLKKLKKEDLKLGFDSCKVYKESDLYDSSYETMSSMRKIIMDTEAKLKRNVIENLEIKVHYDIRQILYEYYDRKNCFPN